MITHVSYIVGFYVVFQTTASDNTYTCALYGVTGVDMYIAVSFELVNEWMMH